MLVYGSFIIIVLPIVFFFGQKTKSFLKNRFRFRQFPKACSMFEELKLTVLSMEHSLPSS